MGYIRPLTCLASAPEEFIVRVPSQVIADVPVNVPRALLPEFSARRRQAAFSGRLATRLRSRCVRLARD
ncbi:hypothetical protein L5014_26900 [Paraburkholderia sp. RG36]|uniref:Uncharacterized protein n=1 Tax=Paraburkholderia tagetis TaxID=2913261 RepID=A0A9X1RVM7_9BURK|nr:hypothetical protein [Paraburkholderia tagetis]MCG5076932.1 hypothetical protein [Paraburkholderia tagetis]